MVEAIVFWLFLLSACGTVTVLGRRSEALFAAFLVACAASTVAFHAWFGWVGAQPYILVVDGLLLLYVLLLARRTTSYWPIWFAGFQMIGVATQLAALLFPSAEVNLYLMLTGFWAIPATLAMAVGVVRDHFASKA